MKWYMAWFNNVTPTFLKVDAAQPHGLKHEQKYLLAVVLMSEPLTQYRPDTVFHPARKKL